MKPELCGINGRLHSGALMTLLDTLSYLTAAFNMPVPKAMVTTEMSINNYSEAEMGSPVHLEVYSERVTD